MKYMHMRFQNSKGVAARGGVTAAYEIKDDRIVYSVAQCHRRDNFCRKLGRDIALGRYLAGNTYSVSKIGDSVRKNIADSIYAHYEDHGFSDVYNFLY